MISERYSEQHRLYGKGRRRKVMFVAVFLAASVALMFISLAIGQYRISPIHAYEVFFDCVLGNDVSSIDRYVIWDLKVPRAIMGVFVGAGLAVAGACMQSILRNPLADPFTTGISSGASFGATVAILYGVCIIPGLSHFSSIIINAFAMSLVPVAVIVLISRFKRMTPSMAILIGLSIMFIFSSTTSLMKLLADPTDLEEAYIWGVGTLGKATWDNIWMVGLSTMVPLFVLMALSRRINILSAGDRTSISLGVDPERIRLLVLVIVSVMVAVSVSFTGPIAFVGLIAPHVCRMVLGSDNVYLIPASAVLGSAITLVADCISQSISAVYLPVGSVTALFGGPFFLYLLMRNNGGSWGNSR